MAELEIETFVRRALSMGDQVIMPPTMPALSSLIVQVLLAEAIAAQHGPLEVGSDVVEKIAEYFRDQRAPQFVIEEHPGGYVIAVRPDQEAP